MIKKILKENYFYLIILLILIIVFSLIMRSSLHDKIIVFDKKVIDYINNNRSNALVSFFKVLTNFGGFIIPCCILIIILLFNNNRWIFILQTACYSFAGIITYIAKLLAGRARPEIALIKMPISYSFPSGHTLTSIVFYTLLCYLLTYNTKSKYKHLFMVFSVVLALLIAVSRVYLGVHFLSDVLGGLIIAIPCLLMCINIINKNFKEKLVDVLKK